MSAPTICPCGRVPIPVGVLSVDRIGVPGIHRPTHCEVDGLVILQGSTLADAVSRAIGATA